MIITHEVDCAEPARVEHFTAMQDSGLGASVSRCLSCGAQRTFCQPDAILTAGSHEYVSAWRLQPSRIAAQLDPVDLFNLERNPCHPHADSVAPGCSREPIPAIARQPWKESP